MTVWKKVRPRVFDLIVGRVNRCELDRRAAGGRHTVKSARNSPRKNNSSIVAPCTAVIRGRVADCLRGAARNVNPFQLTIGEKIHYRLSPAVQFATTLIGVRLFSWRGVMIRKRWPFPKTS